MAVPPCDTVQVLVAVKVLGRTSIGIKAPFRIYPSKLVPLDQVGKEGISQGLFKLALFVLVLNQRGN